MIYFLNSTNLHLNILISMISYTKFSSYRSNTRFGTSSKMIHHRNSSNVSHNFYFCRQPCLWNSLPPIDSVSYLLFYGITLLNISMIIRSVPIITSYCLCCQCSSTTIHPLQERIQDFLRGDLNRGVSEAGGTAPQKL